MCREISSGVLESSKIAPTAVITGDPDIVCDITILLNTMTIINPYNIRIK